MSDQSAQQPKADVVRALLEDSFDRIRELVTSVTDGASDDLLSYRVDAEANPIGWLVWHLSRIQDDHIADAAGVEQVWPQWRERFGLLYGAEDTGYGHSPSDVAAVRVSADLLAGYHADVDALTRRYLASLTVAELARVVDTRWDPPVTVAVRLVSVVGDCLQHLGQAEYVRGLAKRAGVGSGSGG